MDLQKMKDDMNNAGFSPEAMVAINAIMDRAIKRGKLEKDENDDLCGIIELEVEAAKIEINARKQMISALDDFADSVERAVCDAASKIKKIDQDLAETVRLPEDKKPA